MNRESQPSAPLENKSTGLPWSILLRVLLVGVFFGIVLIKSEVARWQKIHDMFLFREPDLFLVIGTGIGVATILLLLIKKFKIRAITGEAIQYNPKPFHFGVIFGGMLFGAGWAIAGACPGPIYAQIGAGEWMALITFAGAITGMFLYAYLRPWLPG